MGDQLHASMMQVKSLIQSGNGVEIKSFCKNLLNDDSMNLNFVRPLLLHIAEALKVEVHYCLAEDKALHFAEDDLIGVINGLMDAIKTYPVRGVVS